MLNNMVALPKFLARQKETLAALFDCIVGDG
jgi:hypothetical protein